MRTHRVIINILIITCTLMTLPPMMFKAIDPVIVAGGALPKFAAWIFGWSSAIVVLLAILYFMDLRYEIKHGIKHEI